MTPHEISLFVYNLALLPIIFFSVTFILLIVLNLMVTRKPAPKRYPVFDELPTVSVQIPTYNDPIAIRCVQKCLAFDYPSDKYHITIVDDSTDHKTREQLQAVAAKHPSRVSYLHRAHRDGFKAGALKNAFTKTKGELIAIFDSDWIPSPDFLRKAVAPFADKNVALVQTRQGFYNKDTNLITRIAAYTLMIYHTIVMPINHKANIVFFGGTAGVLRRSAIEAAGGWNPHSLTEDSELSVRIFLKGYKTVFVDHETPSEVPYTFEGYIKQQMRWCYGNTRVYFDHARSLFFDKTLSFKQRALVIYFTFGNIIAPLVVLMTMFGFIGWFLGEPQLIGVADVVDLTARFAVTSGFMLIGAATLYKNNVIREFPHFVAAIFTVGIVLAFANSVAFLQAALNRPMRWYCTPKRANLS